MSKLGLDNQNVTDFVKETNFFYSFYCAMLAQSAVMRQ